MTSMLPGRVVQMVDKMLHSSTTSKDEHPRATQAASTTTTKARDDPSGVKMQAATWTSTGIVAVVECPKPAITDANDAVIRITSTAICGSDLHLYLGNVVGMKSGHILGHEPMGIVESVGSDVKNIKAGDRVVVSFCIACGSCYYCKNNLFSSCEMTNPSIVQEVKNI